jgi:hypothetical protein
MLWLEARARPILPNVCEVQRFPLYRSNCNCQAKDGAASALLAPVNLKQVNIAPWASVIYGKFQIINKRLKYLEPKGAPDD